MAGSRKSKSASPPAGGLPSHVACNLQGAGLSGRRVTVGLSGGIDSVVLLDLLHRLSLTWQFELSAVHVNHQLQPEAGKWAAFCRRYCAGLGVPLKVKKVTVAAGNSLEGAARAARYEVLLQQPADFLALAHNADDQAETVLLHLLRGSGIRGLAAMRMSGAPPFAAAAGTVGPTHLLRPLLDVPRAEIAQYAATRGLQWMEDPSNADTRLLRNFIRHAVLPQLVSRMPGCRGALERAAAHAAEASDLLDELAVQDGASAWQEHGLRLAALRSLPAARAKNLLRCYLAAEGVQVPAAGRLEEALRQAVAAGSDHGLQVAFGERELRCSGGILRVVPRRAPPDAGVACVWMGETRLVLPQFDGVLHMRRRRGAGISLARLANSTVVVRPRKGGERLQPDPGRPRRSVKNLLQEQAMPPWERARLPFIFAGERLVCVPGIGIDCEYQAVAGESAVVPDWRPAP